jgi:uncharacterized membrane protein
MKRLMKRLMRLILRVTHINFWTFLAAGLVLFVAGLAAGIVYKKSVGTDLACSFLFIAGIVLLAVAVSRMGGGEVEKPAAGVEEPPAQEEKPEVKKDRGARRRKKAATETVSWNI